jgi:hypothetical protein
MLHHAQVSVRKSALMALCRMLDMMPEWPAVCEAWVRAALPLVRDPEQGIQEPLLDKVAALLLDRAAAAGGGSGRGGEPAEEAAATLRPLLAALALGGRSASSCLSKWVLPWGVITCWGCRARQPTTVCCIAVSCSSLRHGL